MHTDGNDMSRLDRARAVVLVIWPFLACAAAVGILLAATIVSVRAIRERDELAVVARNAADASAAAKRAADAAETEAVHTASLLRAQQERDASREALIDDAIRRIIAGSDEAHATLLAQIARLLDRPVPAPASRASASARPTPTVPSRPPPPTPEATAPTAPPTTAKAPATTTTTCEQRGKSGKCRR